MRWNKKEVSLSSPELREIHSIGITIIIIIITIMLSCQLHIEKQCLQFVSKHCDSRLYMF